MKNHTRLPLPMLIQMGSTVLTLHAPAASPGFDPGKCLYYTCRPLLLSVAVLLKYMYPDLFNQVSYGWRFKILPVFTIKTYIDTNTVANLPLCTFVSLQDLVLEVELLGQKAYAF